MHTAAVLAAVVAGLYALALMLLLVVSVGDGDHVLNGGRRTSNRLCSVGNC